MNQHAIWRGHGSTFCVWLLSVGWIWKLALLTFHSFKFALVCLCVLVPLLSCPYCTLAGGTVSGRMSLGPLLFALLRRARWHSFMTCKNLKNKCLAPGFPQSKPLTFTRVCAQSFSHVWLFATPWTAPGSSVHGVFQARVLEWVAISYSRGSSWPRDCTHVSCISYLSKGILYYLRDWK